MEWIFRCAPACEQVSIGFGKIEYFRFNKMIESGDRGGWGMTHNAKVCGIVYYSVGLCVCVRHLNSLFGERAREREITAWLSACLLACLLDVGCARFRVFMHVRLILIVEKLFFLQQQQWRRRHHSMFAMYTIYAYKIDLENANAKRTHAPFTHPRSMCYDLLSDA